MEKNKNKRILILSLVYLPDMIGGAEIAVKEITDRVFEKDAFFDMITLRLNSNLPKFERVGNINVYRVGFSIKNPRPAELVRFPLYLNKILFPILAVFKAKKLDRICRYDKIWSIMSFMGMTAVLIRTFVRKIPFILTLQEGDNLDKFSNKKSVKIFRSIFDRAFSEAEKVQAISSYLADWGLKMGAKKVEVIPNGVDLKKFKSGTSEARDKIRFRYGVSPEESLIITVSRLVEKNGLDILIRSLKFMSSEIKLLVIGDGPLLDSLKKMADDFREEDRVIFTGSISPEQIPEYLSAGDVFCRPSRTEGQGIAFLEAMAVGLPVVATSVGGIAEFLKDKETGLVALPEDPEDVARKILIVLRDKSVRENVVQNAQKMVLGKYDWDRISPSFVGKFFM